LGNLTEEDTVAVDCYFDGSGHWLRSLTQADCAAMVSAKKGGILSLDFRGRQCSDFGWIVRKNGKEWVSHWWGDFWNIERTGNSIKISGHLTPHKANISSPFKHMTLRALSLLFGRHVIEVLKEKMIFKENQVKGLLFRRAIRFLSDRVEVVDVIGVDDLSSPIRAPRSSKRHVASADSYHKEDLRTISPEVEKEETRRKTELGVEIKTIYRRRS
jgi:hypothetical protein